MKRRNHFALVLVRNLTEGGVQSNFQFVKSQGEHIAEINVHWIWYVLRPYHIYHGSDSFRTHGSGSCVNHQSEPLVLMARFIRKRRSWSEHVHYCHMTYPSMAILYVLSKSQHSPACLRMQMLCFVSFSERHIPLLHVSQLQLRVSQSFENYDSEANTCIIANISVAS